MNTKRQFAAVDIAKYISSILVVCIHVYPFVEISESFNTFWVQTVCRLAVPFFFVSTAYFYFSKYDESDWLDHLKAYLLRIGKLYLIWTIIYLPYTIYDYIKAKASIFHVLSYLRDAILNGSYYHLWFLPACMLSAAIVTYLFHKKGLMKTLRLCLILYFVGYLINIYTPVWQSLPYVSIFFGYFTKVFTTARNGLFFGPIFMAIGLLLCRTKRLPLKTSVIGFFVSFILLIIEFTIYSKIGVLHDLTSMYLLLVPTTFFLVNVLLKMRTQNKPVYPILRQESSIIYTSHILFAKPLLAWLSQAHLVVFFLTLAGAQALATWIVSHEERYPWLKNMV